MATVTSTAATMTLLGMQVVDPGPAPDDDGPSEPASGGFFEDLPIYGRWLFALGMAALAAGAVAGAYYFELYAFIYTGSMRGKDAADKLMVDFDGIEVGSNGATTDVRGNPPSAEYTSNAFTQQASSGRSGAREQGGATHVTGTPLEARSHHRKRRPPPPSLSASLSTAEAHGRTHAADDNIVRQTSHRHLELSKLQEEDGDVSFGY